MLLFFIAFPPLSNLKVFTCTASKLEVSQTPRFWVSSRLYRFVTDKNLENHGFQSQDSSILLSNLVVLIFKVYLWLSRLKTQSTKFGEIHIRMLSYLIFLSLTSFWTLGKKKRIRGKPLRLRVCWNPWEEAPWETLSPNFKGTGKQKLKTSLGNGERSWTENAAVWFTGGSTGDSKTCRKSYIQWSPEW